VKRVLLGSLWLLAVVLPAPAQSDVQKKKTIAYIQNLQADDGSFRVNAAAKTGTI
jgi:prenyltransferase beta subunit